MHLSAYTDDAICKAMGLAQFKPTSAPSVLRLLLKPSFDPEVCLTAWPTEMQLVALDRMLWRETVPCRLPEHAEAVSIDEVRFQTIVDAFNRARSEYTSPRFRAIADGMSTSVICINDGTESTCHGHPLEPAQREFVGTMLSLGHSLARSPHLMNRLAHCAGYIGRKIPLEKETDSPHASRVLILGEPQHRSEVLDALRAAQRAKKS